MYDINKDNLKWKDKNYKEMSYIKTLYSMCNCYGTFCGLYHSNKFWTKTKKELKNMTEKDAEIKVFEIMNNAKISLSFFKQCQ